MIEIMGTRNKPLLEFYIFFKGLVAACHSFLCIDILFETYNV